MSHLTKRTFTYRQIAGYRSQVKAAINGCQDGAYVTIDLKTAHAILDICDQAIHAEKNAEQPALELK